MRMIQIAPVSLKLRCMLLAFIALSLALPATLSVLKSAYETDAKIQIKQKLEIQSLVILAEIEFQDGIMTMPEQMPISGFNLPNSGLYATIFEGSVSHWQSPSSLDIKAPPPAAPMAVGNSRFTTITVAQNLYFQYTFKAEFEDEGSYRPVTVSIIQDTVEFDRRYQQYTHIIHLILAGLALLIMAILAITLVMALYPLSHLKRQIKALQDQQVTVINTRYPPELDSVKSQINRLVEAEQAQRQRYRNSLGDLAHSLKTPLAVLMTIKDLPQLAKPAIGQLDAIIQRQLKRATTVNASSTVEHSDIFAITEQITFAMAKIYKDKQLIFDNLIPADTMLPMDKTDIMEVMGNLLDNAAKAASRRVEVSILSNNLNQLHIVVDDDGNGIPAKQRQELTIRGNRLDSYTEGQGIGLAVVWDILTAYSGTLVIGDNPLGGARFEIQIPL